MKVSLFRRPLPSPPAYAFSSDVGKTYFASAMRQGFCQSYFSLAENFRTQDEPAYCGLSTLVMALNALRVDPGRPWKGPWRFFHEDMLDCCRPLDMVKEKGITIQDFACLARCNFAEADLVYAQDGELEAFRAAVRRATSADVEEAGVLVVSYDRSVLLQTGTGHFSPVAAYDPESDMALVMDVARFKYPPQWLPVATLFDAMRSEDAETGRPRGYLVVSSRQEQGLLFTLKRSSHTHWPALGRWWSQLRKSVNEAVERSLRCDDGATPTPVLADAAAVASASRPACCTAEETARALLSTFPGVLLENVLTTYSGEYGAGALEDVREQLDELVALIEGTTAFREVDSYAGRAQVEVTRSRDDRVDVRHFYTLLLLAALLEEPIRRNCREPGSCELTPMVVEVEQGPRALRDEVENVRKTLNAVMIQLS